MTEQLKLRTSVKPELTQLFVRRATILSALGAILLLSALFMSLDTLKVWGLPIFVAAGGLFSAGLIPYRQLTRRERKPDEIVVEGDVTAHYYAQGRLMFSIPIVSIAKYAYLEKGPVYGIGIWLKQPLEKPIQVHHSNFDLEKFIEVSRIRYECDLFLPYFTERSYNTLIEFRQEAE